MVTSVTPAAGSGSQQSFAVVTNSTAGSNNINEVEFGFTQHPVANGWAPAIPPDCDVQLDPLSGSTGTLVLNPGGTGFVPYSGGATTIFSSQPGCNIQITAQNNLPAASVSWSAPNLTVNFPIVFPQGGSLAGGTTIFGRAYGTNSTAYPVAALGTWTVVGAPSIVSLSPTGGTGPSQTFTAQVAYGAGSSNINSAEILVNGSSSHEQACDVKYDHVANLFYLRSDNGQSWLGGYAPATSFTIQNSQCSVNGPITSPSMVGSTLTIAVPVTFTPGFFGTNGVKFVYVEALDNNNLDTGYQQKGNWNVDQPPALVSVTP